MSARFSISDFTWPHLLVTELMAYLVPIGEVGWSWVEVGFLEIENRFELRRQKNFLSNLCLQPKRRRVLWTKVETP